MKVDNLTRNEVASCFGVDPSQITRWKAAGMPNKGKTFDLPACIQWRVAKTQADGKANHGDCGQEKDQLQELRKEQTKIKKIQRLLLKAKLVSRRKIEAELAGRAFELKSSLLLMDRSAAMKIATRCGANPADVKKILRAEIRKLLEHYARPIQITEEKIK